MLICCPPAAATHASASLLLFAFGGYHFTFYITNPCPSHIDIDPPHLNRLFLPAPPAPPTPTGSLATVPDDDDDSSTRPAQRAHPAPRMVHLSISAIKGNQGGRTYPYAGYLGLSKVTVEGVVRTRVEDDHRLLPASSITISIRCYEARTRFAVAKVNLLLDATQTLWAAGAGRAYEDVGSSDHPFRIALPAKVGGFSTMQHPEYRIFWRLEAG